MQSDRQNSPPAVPMTGSLARYAVSLALLVVVIGGIAWVVQYLPRWQAAQEFKPTPQDKELVRFAMERARWNNNNDPNLFREFEPGDLGHYDFLFKNMLGQDIEVVHYSSTCDCASMKACMLPLAEVERLGKIQAEKPGDALQYEPEPKWEDLPRDPLKPIHLTVKANEGGVVRVQWIAKKLAGQELRVEPAVFIQPDGDPSGRKGFKLQVPAMMTYPVRIFPARQSVGKLNLGSVTTAEFDAWSATRDDFKLELTPAVAEPFFDVELTPLTKQGCAGLERALNDRKLTTRVKSGYHVTITIHESKDGQQLDLGTFLRKFAITLNGNLMADLPGPEVVGRVALKDLTVGVEDDQGKIRFKSFDRASGATKTLDLLAPKDATLEHYRDAADQPTWLQVKLTSDEQLIDGKKRQWHLEATVPPKTPVARSFEEPDAVVLRISIKGEPARLVRIPIEGHVSGR